MSAAMTTAPVSRRAWVTSAAVAATWFAAKAAIIGRAEAATLKLKCSSSLPNDPKYANGRVYYDNLIKQIEANGLSERIDVTFFPENQLGQEIDVINSVKLGVVDLMVSGSSISANLVPLVGTFDLGYLFSSFPQQTKAFEQGAAKPIEEALFMGANIRVIAGSGLPLELTFYPMGVGALFMTVFALDQFRARPIRDAVAGVLVTALIAGLYLGWDALVPASVPSSGTLMLIGFLIALFGGLSIGFALALAALIFIWVEGTLPGVIFAQQMARGIDNFVLLAIPFFILVGYLMEAGGMSTRLIESLQRAVGGMRGGLNVAMVISMVLFSGISGSKMADVAAVGSVLIPAARRTRQNPGSAVALLAASAVMAETIPPCINLIILGFVANLSVGGLFVAGLLPAGVMALALIAVSIVAGRRPARAERAEPHMPISGLWSGAVASFGLIAMIFFGFKSGFATATEISAFAAAYAMIIGSLIFRKLQLKSAAASFVQAAARPHSRSPSS
jgi:hypothetical protein